MEPIENVLFWVIGGFLSMLTVLGNSLAIYLIISWKRLHTSTNWLLLSLAVADLGVGLTCLPSRACVLASFCSKCVATALRWLFLNLSLANLCALTVDRHAEIVYPLKYAKFKAKRCHLFLISAAWILPFIVHFTFAWMYCTRMETLLKIFYTVQTFVFKIPPYLILFTSCSRTLYIAHRQKKRYNIRLSQLRFNGFSFEGAKGVRSRGRIAASAKALGIVVAIFLTCYTIDIARLVCFSFKCASYIPCHLVSVQRLLFVCNSASNPLIYGFLKHDIRCELKRLFRWLCS